MSLEKLLIFGFALATAIVITVSLGNVADKRKPQKTTYEGEVKEMIEKTR